MLQFVRVVAFCVVALGAVSAKSADYVVVVSGETLADAGWKQVVETLVDKLLVDPPVLSLELQNHFASLAGHDDLYSSRPPVLRLVLAPLPLLLFSA